jgi:RNA polymerase sigma-70 factor (ECF subfamily)
MGSEMDDDGFETIMTAHHAEIHRYLARVTARPSDADDLSQETFLRAYRAWRGLPADANRRAWLFTIATNLCKNHFRGESRRRRALAAAVHETPHEAASWPESEALAREAHACVERAVAALPFKQRLAFVMRKMHGLDYDAIGAGLDCSGESARAHVFQALKKIRRALDELVPAQTEPAR